MQLCSDKKELDLMVARVSESKRILSNTKKEVMNYYKFLSKSVYPDPFDVRDFFNSLWIKIKPKLHLLLPLLIVVVLLRGLNIIRSLFSIIVAIELIIFILAWKDPKEITSLSGIRKFAQDSKLLIKQKKDKTTKKVVES